MIFKPLNKILILVFCFGLIFGVSSVVKAEKGKAGVLSKIEGTVELKQAGTLIFEPAQVEQVLNVGDRIRTKADGWAEISLDNGNVVELQENSDLLIKKFVQNLEKEEYENILDMNLGKLRAKVEKLKGDSVFEIHTPTAVAAARGTIIYLEAGSELSKILVEEGIVEFLNRISGMKVVVKNGETSTAYRDGAISNPCIPSAGQRSGIITGFNR